MNDPWIDQLRAGMVDTEPRPGFRDELRGLLDAEWDGLIEVTPTVPHRRRRWMLGAVAAAIVVLVTGVLAFNRGDDAVAPTTDPGEVTDPPEATSAPDTTLPETSPPSQPDVPILLEDWPWGGDSPGSVEDLPLLLPSEPVPNQERIVRSESVESGFAFAEYVQTYVDTDDNAWLLVRTVAEPAPATPEEFRTEQIDTSAWVNPWTDAYLVQSPGNVVFVELAAPGGLVEIRAFNLEESAVINLARTMQRRPSTQPGWDLEPPAGLRQFAESESGPQRALVWFDAEGTPIAELRIQAENAEAVITGWSETAEVDTIDLDGTPVVIAVDGIRVTVAWTTEGAEVLFGYVGDRDAAERIARSIAPVDEAVWLDASEPPDPDDDGCQSLFC